MSIDNYKNNKGGYWMIALEDIAYLKWDKQKAEMLDQMMSNYKPKKLSGRKLAELIMERGYPANHYTIYKMRSGIQDHVVPDVVVGICEVFGVEIDHFMGGLYVRSKKL